MPTLLIRSCVLAVLGFGLVTLAPAYGQDCNTNGVVDECEIAGGSADDCNTNNTLDVCDIESGASLDCNTDVVPDECEDCNTNGLADSCDLAASFDSFVQADAFAFPEYAETINSMTIPPGATDDVNVGLVVTHPYIGDTEYWLERDGLSADLMITEGGGSDNCAILFDDEASAAPPPYGPLFGTFRPSHPLTAFDDGSQAGIWTLHVLSNGDAGVVNEWSLHFRIAPPAADDCNSNGLPDECDLSGGSSEDCDTDGLPDDCEPDCNANGQNDDCDLSGGTSDDCNTNAVPDDCENAEQSWDNGPFNEVDGLFNQYDGIAPSEVADDFVVAEGHRRLVFATFESFEHFSFQWTGKVQVSTWADAGGVPSETPFDQAWLTLWGGGATRVLKHCNDWVGCRYEYQLSTDLKVPDTGVCWFSARPESYGGNALAFWLTSATPAEFGESYFRSPFFGYDTWTPTQDAVGQNWDFAFTLTLAGADCNTNGQVDPCDIADGSAFDCDTNEIPDQCETDCNTNGQTDTCDGPDCNTNTILDLCDIGFGSSPDDDFDGQPDECASLCVTCDGDMNQDSFVDGDDITAFVNRLLENLDGDELVCFSPCADIDDDGDLDSADVSLFATALLFDSDTLCP